MRPGGCLIGGSLYIYIYRRAARCSATRGQPSLAALPGRDTRGRNPCVPKSPRPPCRGGLASQLTQAQGMKFDAVNELPPLTPGNPEGALD